MSLFHKPTVSTGTNESDDKWEPEDFQEPEPKWFFVSIYMVDKAFGGHEEGGWYYEYGMPCTDFSFVKRGKMFRDRGQALEYRNKLQKLCDRINKGRRPIWSVLSEGEYRAVMDDESYPRNYPTESPRYE